MVFILKMKKKNTDIVRICTACGKTTNYGRKNKPKVCPFCQDVYWDKPKDERDLFLLQETFVANGRDNETLGLIYEKLVKYSENVIKKSLKKSGKILRKEDLIEKSESTAIKLIERYLKYPDSIVESSFGGMLRQISRGVLYSKSAKQSDQEVSLDKQLAEDFIMLDNPSYFIVDPVAKRNFEKKYELDAHDELAKATTYTISEELIKLISGMSYRIRISQSSENSIYFLIGLKNFLHKDKLVLMEQYYNYCKNIDRLNIENGKIILRRYLLERMRTE